MSRLKITPSEIQKYLSMLELTPKRIERSIADLAVAQLSTAPAPKVWSAVEVIAHLRACNDIWSNSIYIMLTEEQPTLPLLDARRWAKIMGYASLVFTPHFKLSNWDA